MIGVTIKGQAGGSAVLQILKASNRKTAQEKYTKTHQED